LTYRNRFTTPTINQKLKRTHLADDDINAMAHFFCALSSGAPVVPDLPCRVPGLDLVRLQAFILTIVPFPDFLCNNMCGLMLHMIKEEVEGVVRTDSWGDEDHAHICRVQDFYTVFSNTSCISESKIRTARAYELLCPLLRLFFAARSERDVTASSLVCSSVSWNIAISVEWKPT
jgi:hypothetical protein